MFYNKDSMLFWYPKIKSLNISQPKTEIVEVPIRTFCDMIDGKYTSINEYIELIKIAANKIGYPLFLRTDLASGKHDWENSCFVKTEKDLESHLFCVVENNFLSDLDPSAIVFREYIQMDSKFTAFWGKLPISAERRYFVKNGLVLCWHVYWPEDAIKLPSEENWKQLLGEMNQESSGEISLLTEWAKEVSRNIKGYWSVDFCRTKEKNWMLIDLATGEHSWHPECSKKL